MKNIIFAVIAVYLIVSTILTVFALDAASTTGGLKLQNMKFNKAQKRIIINEIVSAIFMGAIMGLIN